MSTEKFAVWYSVLFLMSIVCVAFPLYSCHSPCFDPDLLTSVPLHRRQTPTVDPSEDSMGQLRHLNYNALQQKRQKLLETHQQQVKHQDKETDSTSTGVYYVPLRHQGSLKQLKQELDGNFAKPHDGVQKYATVTAEEFERQRLGFEKQLAFLNEHPEKNKKVIEKLTASFDALRNTYQQGFDPVLQQTALHQPLLYGFYAICFISILLALAS